MIEPYSGAPSLSYIIARRICDKTRTASALVFVQGGMGVGKSTFSLSLGEEIAKWVSKFQQNDNPEQYFNIDNVRTVEREGGLDILTSDALLREHSILLIDDAWKKGSPTEILYLMYNSTYRYLISLNRLFTT